LVLVFLAKSWKGTSSDLQVYRIESSWYVRNGTDRQTEMTAAAISLSKVVNQTALM